MEDLTPPATPPRNHEEMVEIPLYLLRWLLVELDQCAGSMHIDIAPQSAAATSGSPKTSPNLSTSHLPGGDTVIHLPSKDFRPYSEMPSLGVTLPGDFRISLDSTEVARLTTCALTAIRGLSARHYQLLDRWKTVSLRCRRTQRAGEELVTGLLDERDSIQKGSWDGDLETLRERVQGKIDRLVETYLKAVKAADGEGDG